MILLPAPQLFICVSSSVFLALFGIWQRSNWLNLILKLLFLFLGILGLAILFNYNQN